MFRRGAPLLAKLGEGVADGMGLEVGQACPFERLAEYAPDGFRCAPVLALQARRDEAASRPDFHPCRGKQRVRIAPMERFAKVAYPFRQDGEGITADREEPGRKRLGEFGMHLAGILIEHPLAQIDVLHFQSYDRPVPRAREERQRQQGAVALLDIGGGGSHRQGVVDPFKAGKWLLAHGLGNPDVTFRQVEIVGVRIADLAPEAG